MRASSQFVLFFCFGAAALHGIGRSAAQVSAAASGIAPSGNAPAPYTLRTRARTVLADVVVVDGDGRPVRGLPRDAFHLSDNGEAQRLTSFEERRGGATRPAFPHAAPGVYTNDPARLPPVLDVLLIDLVRVNLEDQMWLADQLQKFIRALPSSNAALAVYLRAGFQCVQVTDFTDDRERLLEAVQRSLPQFPQLGSQYFVMSDEDVLNQIAGALRGLPGRKNVLWFTGQQNLLLSNPTALGFVPSSNVREIYDTLEAERISIYPVDARGLTIEPTGFAERSAMEQVAKATGGHAYYNTNGLADAATKVIDSDNDFYTLSYTPSNFVEDDKWHRIDLKVDGKDLHLSYRRGYFADDNHRERPREDEMRTRLLSGGQTVKEKPKERTAPLVFAVTVTPTVPKPGEVQPPFTARYLIRYLAKASRFQQSTAKGESHVKVGFGLQVTNRWGTPVANQAQSTELTVATDRLAAAPDSPIHLEQTVNLPVGDDYLTVALCDQLNGRLGIIHLSQHVPDGRGK